MVVLQPFIVIRLHYYFFSNVHMLQKQCNPHFCGQIDSRGKVAGAKGKQLAGAFLQHLGNDN
jgi:hypothetical protein